MQLILNPLSSKYLIFLFTLILSYYKFLSDCITKDDLVKNLPSFPKEQLPCMYSGYISINEQSNSKLFYWLFTDDIESPSKNKPLIIWLGGGVSSLFSLFTEIGPLKISNKGEFKIEKETSWITKSNILYVDQPLGIGYSFTNDIEAIPKNQITISQNFYKFISKFFIIHNYLVNNKLYIMGDSYAARFIPSIAKLILEENKKIDEGQSHNQKINLKKIAIGNGIFDLKIQKIVNKDLALGLNFVSEIDDQPQLDLLSKRCDHSLSTRAEDSYKRCHKLEEYITSIAGDIDNYDIRKSNEFETVQTKYMTDYLNRIDVITALNLKDQMIKKENNYWSLFNVTVHNSLIDDYNFNSSLPIIDELLDYFNIPIIIYAGQFDIFESPQGIERALHSLKFKEILNWKNSTRIHWKIPIETTDKYVYAGYIKQYGNLLFISMRKAGHLVPKDRPATTLNLIEHILSNNILIQCPDDSCSLTKIKCSVMENCNGNGICAENTGGRCICNSNFYGPDCSLTTELLLSKNEAKLKPSETKLFSLTHYPTDVILEIEAEDDNLNLSILDKNMSEYVYDLSKHMITYRLDKHKLSLIVEKENFENYLIVITNLQYEHEIKLKFWVTDYSN